MTYSAHRAKTDTGPCWIRTSLLVMCVLLPTAYRAERGTLLVLAFAAMLLLVLRQGRLRLHPILLAWSFACAAAGLFFMLRGALAGAPGFPRVITVYVVWPIILTLAIAAFSTPGALRWASRGLIVAQALISAYAVVFVLVTAGLLPPRALPPLDLDPQISLSTGFIEISFHSLNSMLFLVPFSMATLLVHEFRHPAHLTLWAIVVIVGTGVAIVSGRRALQLIVVLSPVTVLALAYFGGPRLRQLALRRAGVLATAGVVAFLVFGAAVVVSLELKPDVLWAAFAQGFAASSDSATSPRMVQFEVLIREWLDNPFLGSGLGAAASGIIRSSEQPWAYELSYVALLYQVGLVGFCFYASAVGWLYCRSIGVIRRDPVLAPIMIAMLTGCTAFLLGNATNPYLAAFDYLWTLFLPLAVVNVFLIEEGPPALMTGASSEGKQVASA